MLFFVFLLVISLTETFFIWILVILTRWKYAIYLFSFSVMEAIKIVFLLKLELKDEFGLHYKIGISIYYFQWSTL